MKSVMFAIALLICGASFASAQCPGGVCPSNSRSVVRSVLKAPVAAMHGSVVRAQTTQVRSVVRSGRRPLILNRGPIRRLLGR